MFRIITIVMAFMIMSAQANESCKLFEAVRDKVVVIQCDDSSGSGFVCEMDGMRFLVTNKHVIEGQMRVSARFPNGNELKIGKMELAKDSDLVRFAVSPDQPALTCRSAEPKMHEKIFVFGNSEGASVLTSLEGEIVGVGAGQIEVTAKFVHGNSGSAVLDENGDVLGVATYAIKNTDPKDWVNADSRFSEVRRFALRLTGIVWVKSDLKKFRKEVEQAQRARQEAAGVLPEITASFSGITISKGVAIGRHVNNNIYGCRHFLSFKASFSSKKCKKPVIRAVVLYKGGTVADYLWANVKRGWGFQPNPGLPVYSYGVYSQDRSVLLEDDSCVYYIEGVSYYQRVCEMARAKGIEFCVGLTDDVVAYRLECWQNGALVGVHNSMRPQTLNAKGVPVDWFIDGKYPRLYHYKHGGSVFDYDVD